MSHPSSLTSVQALTLQAPAPPRPAPCVSAAAILVMVTQNGMATMFRVHKPHAVELLCRYRADLLADPFFDRNHRPEELRHRIRTEGILWMDLVVLLSRLIRVTMHHPLPLTAEEVEERVAVRNEVLDQPFFDVNHVGGRNPFADDVFDDEGVVF